MTKIWISNDRNRILAFVDWICINIVHSTFCLSACDDICSSFFIKLAAHVVNFLVFSDKQSIKKMRIYKLSTKNVEFSALFIGTKRTFTVLFCPFFCHRDASEVKIWWVESTLNISFCTRVHVNGQTEKVLGNLLMGFCYEKIMTEEGLRG